ncbi:DUF2298 domain-containing protein [Patescibacteria group bacterium]|nr:DUF2298 domain-containing protein [Patescibacteria group bacterium]
MTWLFTSLQWYFYLLVIGMIFFPLTKKIFGRFSFDSGYPFAKTLAIIFMTYSVYILGTIKILPFTRLSIFIVIGLFAIANLIVFKKKGEAKTTSSSRLIIIGEELLFLGAFIFWTFIRAQEPSIHSLEKFMDFGFINSILRSKFFPPLDMWYTPLPINYYYFGHLTGAFLIRLTNVVPDAGYNLILSTIFGLGVTGVFSLVTNIIDHYQEKIKKINIVIYGLIGTFIVNLGGNLHTIYLFTKGYPNDKPVPFWEIFSGFNPSAYWYPNATRFIPFTIHEFPSYSYVVADLHGHVFDIPFVLITLAILFILFTSKKTANNNLLLTTVFLGFLTAIHYMTNAFDGPIYILLTTIIFFILWGLSWNFVSKMAIMLVSFIIFALPFSFHFTPFVSGIGVNCSPDFLTAIGKLGPFLFEKGNCQASPFWMLFVLWGFFWINFALFLVVQNKIKTNQIREKINNFLFVIFSFGTFLIIIPEFFYIKDIYPQHFRANTMFKLGYQAFIMMGINTAIILFLIKSLKKSLLSYLLTFTWLFFFFFVAIYPFFSTPSYYGQLDRQPVLDGSLWLNATYPQDKEIIDYLNRNIKGQPTILEAQGDSYTDYERISAYTGLPTVAGWWVHEWLWRGSPDVVGKRIPDIEALYQSKDLKLTGELIKKYKIKYVIVSGLEKQKYPDLYEAKFSKLGRLIFRSSNGIGAIYQIN